MRRNRHDPAQGALFEALPFAPAPVPTDRPGDLNISIKLRDGLARAIKECPLSRVDLAAKMTLAIFGEAGDSEITKSQIDSWTAPSRDGWRFPLEFLPAFIAVTKAFWLLDWIAEAVGCKILVGDEARVAELGAINLQMKGLAQRAAELKSNIKPETARRLIRRKGDAR